MSNSTAAACANGARSNDDSGARRIVVVGGGIGAAEAALTLAIGLPDAHVTLLGRSSSIHVLPDLVYVPFGVSPRTIDVPIERLLPHGVRGVVTDVLSVDATRRRVETRAGSFPYDVLVAAPGASPTLPGAHSLRSLVDAMRIRAELAALVIGARRGERRTITLRAESENSWTAPACELALLIGAWIRALGLDDRIETLLATTDAGAFEWFGPRGERMMESALRRSRVQVATSVPHGRLNDVDGDLVVDFGSLAARSIPGLPGRGPDGWYEPSATFEVAPDTFVIGDAVALPYRAGFATAWQARCVLRALGGNPERLGLKIDGIPNAAVEYQMDLADGVLRARVNLADSLATPYLGHAADLEVIAGACPDKLAGLLLHERVLSHDEGLLDAPIAYRDALRQRSVA